MKITHATNHVQKLMKMHFFYMTKHQLGQSADEGQNCDTVMFLATTLKTILMGFKKNP